ncbi:MAG: serine/threonine protein kinase [Deltaproteobacteria bacterium]|nr:serine/threonine protein kinase [Deltaproteobacteria bacterium]
MQDIQAQNGPRDKYEILRVVNRGGMGEIALARVRGTKGFEKLVILKRLRADAEREDHRQMFDVEAELMSRIEHPNIVQVFDQPVVGGVQYLAMAYLRGRNLDQLIRRLKKSGERLMPQFCLTVVCEVLRGLAFVHRLKDEDGTALGVVHQDITPSNIMVSFFGEVKITDFGIAYVTSRDGGRRKGVLKGKPRYVSPEVLAGRRVNNRADIYGVGVVLYEMLAAKALFARPSVDETLAAVARNELPELSREFPHVTAGFIELLGRSLAKDPQDRFRTAEEMFAEASAELSKIGGPMPPSHIGFVVRKAFHDAPDLPEADPTLDAAIEKTAIPKVAFRAPDLEQTLSELDRLLGASGENSSSHEIFSLPPELATELDELDDMDPFDAKTPIPELALSGPNGEELLMNAIMKGPIEEVLGSNGFTPFPLLPSLPSLNLIDSQDGLHIPSGASRPTPSPPPLLRRSTAPNGMESPLGTPSWARSESRPNNSGTFAATQLEPLDADDPLAKSVIARSRRAKLSAKAPKSLDGSPRSIESPPETSSPDRIISPLDRRAEFRSAEIRSADVPIDAPVEVRPDPAVVLELAAAKEAARKAEVERDEHRAKSQELLAVSEELRVKGEELRAKAEELERRSEELQTKNRAELDAARRSHEVLSEKMGELEREGRESKKSAYLMGLGIGFLSGVVSLSALWLATR